MQSWLNQNGLVYLFIGIRVLTVVAAGLLATYILGRIFAGLRKHALGIMLRRGGTLDLETEKRATTVASVIRKPLVFILWGAVFFMALQEMGFHIEALLAGAGLSAGIVGVAVGLGAQSLIKDIIGGLFILFENQLRVNDVVNINGTGGLVQEINLRTTILRSENGAVHVFPNGSIQTLSNLTREFSYYVFEIVAPYEQDPERALQIMREVADELKKQPDFGSAILGDLDVMGVDKLAMTGITLKARIKTLPTKQWLVGREMNRRLRNRFSAEGLAAPTAVTTVRFDEPIVNREELRTLIREVLDERESVTRGRPS